MFLLFFKRAIWFKVHGLNRRYTGSRFKCLIYVYQCLNWRRRSIWTLCAYFHMCLIHLFVRRYSVPVSHFTLFHTVWDTCLEIPCTWADDSGRLNIQWLICVSEDEQEILTLSHIDFSSCFSSDLLYASYFVFSMNYLSLCVLFDNCSVCFRNPTRRQVRKTDH